MDLILDFCPRCSWLVCGCAADDDADLLPLGESSGLPLPPLPDPVVIHQDEPHPLYHGERHEQ